MNNINTTGYTIGTETEKNQYNVIPSSIITMKNVNKPLTLIPIVNGKPRYDMKKIANPGDPDIDFGNEVSGVLELPYAQSQWGRITSPFSNDQTDGGMTNPYLTAPVAGGIANNVNVPPIDNSLQGYNYDPMTAPELNSNGLPPAVDFGAPTLTNEQRTYMQQQYSNRVADRANSMEVSSTNMLDMGLDPNARQQQEANTVKARNGAPFVGAINPYGSYNAQNASVMLGASIADGNTMGIIGSAGKIALELGRNAFSGFGAMKKYNEQQQEYLDRDAEARQRMEENYIKEGGTIYQEGGKISNKKKGLLLTGNFLEGNEDHPTPNSELERGEIVQTPDGNTLEMIGKRHSEGGELVSLPEGTKVVSDYLKIGGKLATYFKKNYNLNVSAGSTFATVLDKYKKKIGLTELLEEEAKIMQKIVDQEDVEFESTREINLQVLSKKANELQPQKAPLEEDFNMFTNFVFEKQEESKPKEKQDFEKQEGGQVDQQQVQVMSAIQAYAEANGQNPQDVVNQLQSMPPEEQQAFISQIMNGGQAQESQGNAQIEQLIQEYAQLTNQDPETIIQSLQQLDEAGLQQAIQQMIEVVQKTAQPPQGNPEEQTEQEVMQAGGFISGLRNKQLPATYDAMPFTAVNVDGVVDYDLQHLNPTTGVYDSFDPNVRLGRYMTDVPVGAENYFEAKPDGNYGLKEGVNYSDFQRGYNDLMGRTKSFFETQTEGLTPAQQKQYVENLNKYNNDIIFTTDKESEYKGKTARGIDNKFGQFTSSRSGYQRPIVTPEQRQKLEAIGVFKLSQLLNNNRAKDIVGEELYNQLEKENKDFKGIDYRILDKQTPGTTPSEATSTNTDTTNGSSNIAPYQGRGQGGIELPMAVPDQSNLPPIYLPTSMRQVGSVQADRVFLSPEENLKELSRQANTASNTLVNMNPYTAGAGLANLQAQQNNSINQAITQTNIANQQDQRNVSNINEERIMKRDQTNLGLADKYEREQIVGSDNFYNSWINYIDNRNRQNLSNFNLQQNINANNAINDNYKIGSMGQIYQTNDPFIIYVNNQPQWYDPKTKQVIQKTTSADGKTTTVTKTGDTPVRRKKKGGLVMTANLSDLLK